ncbi:glycosyltransferase family 39 protein [Streptomyces sp. NPDC005574]|uniref:glycosyltransferase family 39 protein n=1 Tax=Streptomyces sp. NPDC005574 TaxID=3156891 RepID=UPI0033B1D00B
MLAAGLWGLDRGGMWGDESVTFLVAWRTVPQIWRLLHEVDAVHGLYYLFMHAVLPVHPGEVVLRLPSLFAASATAALVAALGVRLSRPRVGLWAGLLYAVTPLTGHYAQEGRSYALVAAGVAAATLLLVRASDGRPGRPGAVWWPYGCVLAVSCLLHELAVLAVCAHAATLALTRVPRAVWAGWARAVAVTGVLLLPLVWVSRRQSGQVAWLVAPGWDRVGKLGRSFAAGPTGAVFWVSVVLLVAGLGARRVAVVAGPLLVLPPAILMSVSQVRPLYHDRYVLYALAGSPLLVAAGADRVATAVEGLRGRRVDARRSRACLGGRSCGRVGAQRWRAGLRGPSYGRVGAPRAGLGGPPAGRVVVLAGVLAVALAFLQTLPLHLEDRSPDHRPDNLAAVAALAARQVRPGDPVLFLPSVERLAALTYPRGFRRGYDIALRESGPRSGTLWGRETGPRELLRRLAPVDRVWVVAEPYALTSRWSPRDPTERAKLTVVREQFTPRREYARRGVTLRLYVRVPPVSGRAGPVTGGPEPGTARPRPARS